MVKLNKTRKTMKQIILSNKKIEMVVQLGNLQGEIKADKQNNVYVTLMDGEVMTVLNQSVPNLRMYVLIGYRNNRLQVLRSLNAFHIPTQPDIPDHNHTWGESTNPTFVRGEQHLPGLVVPADNIAVFFKGWTYFINQIYIPVFEQTIPLAAYVPNEGALFALLEVDGNGVISVLTGNVVASREVLRYADIPTPSSNKSPLGCAVKLYAGQSRVMQGLSYSATDVIDLRWTGYSSGGSGSFISDWDNIQNLPTWIKALESGQLLEYIEIERWSALEGDNTFDFNDFVTDIINIKVNGLTQDPLTYTLSNDGLQVVLDTPLEFDAILTSEHKVEVL